VSIALILLTGAGDFRNKGDAAILEGTINALTSLGIPIVKIYCPVISSWPRDSLHGLRMKHSPSFAEFGTMLQHGLFGSYSGPIPITIFFAPKFLYKILSKLSKSDIMDDLSSTDMIWEVGGGDLVYDNRFIEQIMDILYLKKNQKSRKTVIIGGQSVGPFYSRTSRFSASMFLSNFVDILLLREEKSLEYILHKLKIKLPYTRVISDFSFHVNPRITKNVQKVFQHIDEIRERSLNGYCIGFNARPWFYQKWVKNKTKQNDVYLNFLVNSVKKLCDKGFSVIFYPSSTVPGVADDTEIYNYISRRLKIKNRSYANLFAMVQTNQLNGTESYAVPSKLDAMVAVRSHAAIAAMRSFIPTIHICYHHKGEGIINHIGAPVPCIGLDSVTSMSLTPNELVNMVERQVRDIDKISENIKISIRNKMLEDINILREVFEQINSIHAHGF